MWIRSQDKTRLVNVEIVAVREYDSVIVGHNFSSVVELGSYSTKAKALNVLDEICYQINSLSIYQMPADDDVVVFERHDNMEVKDND